MTQAKNGSTVVMNYVYNGMGERVRKYLNTANTYTLYDEAGRWLGDYGNAGGTAPTQQVIWFDDLPVGVLEGAGANQKLHYIEPDALGTPRVVIDRTRGAQGVAVWTWSLTGEAFGTTPPNENPDGDATAFVFDMRFPGQRYDAASGLNYNYFRDYDGGIGRYVQSDPIGLAGGISTYGYVANSPFGAMDLLGLSGRNWWDVEGHLEDWMHDFHVALMAHAYIHGMNHVTPEAKEFVDQKYYEKLNELGTAMSLAATGFMPGAAAEGVVCQGLVRQGLQSSLRFGGARVRHHTSRIGLAAIRRQGAINPSRGGGVHVELSPFGVPGTAARETGAFGRGAYVEFDAPSTIVHTFVGPRSTGVIPTATPLQISGANPIFYSRPWWRF